ncbi:MAG: hypothetical protein K6G54_07055 [Oscillospiraceae bacterium]|nr:hypothetical protein [Oscillospiraceae bacterium]
MRIAVPIDPDGQCSDTEHCTALRFYEDDHGRVVRRTTETVAPGQTLARLERLGVDVLLCRPLPQARRAALAALGMLLSDTAEGPADDALRAFLGAAVVCDPTNDCNYCGHRDACAMPHE